MGKAIHGEQDSFPPWRVHSANNSDNGQTNMPGRFGTVIQILAYMICVENRRHNGCMTQVNAEPARLHTIPSRLIDCEILSALLLADCSKLNSVFLYFELKLKSIADSQTNGFDF